MPKSALSANSFLKPNDNPAAPNKADRQALLNRLKLIKTRNEWMRRVREAAQCLRKMLNLLILRCWKDL